MTVLKNDNVREKYQEEIEIGIMETNMELLSLDMKVTELNRIVQQAVEAAIPLAEQPKKKWINEKL